MSPESKNAYSYSILIVRPKNMLKNVEKRLQNILERAKMAS